MGTAATWAAGAGAATEMTPSSVTVITGAASAWYRLPYAGAGAGVGTGAGAGA